MRVRRLLPTLLALLAIPILSASAAGNVADGTGDATTWLASVPGAELRVTLIPSGAPGATQESPASLSPGQAKGFGFEVVIMTEAGVSPVDWKAARLQAGNGPAQTPTAVQLPESTEPGKWISGKLLFSSDPPVPDGPIILLIPYAGNLEPIRMTWNLPESEVEPAASGAG